MVFDGRPNNQSGQSLLIVMGLVTMIFLGTMAVAQNVSQHYPIVQKDQIVHEAYRAMQAGVNNYLSMANSNPDTVICGATFDKVSNYPNPTSSSTSTPSLPSGSQLCSGFTTGSWITVPNLASTQGPAAWYLYGSPTIYDCTGSSSQCPQTVWVSLTVVGASNTGTITSYTPGTVTFQPQNGFLLNLWWLNYDQEDPSTVPGSQSCTWYWVPNPDAIGSGCQPVDFVSGETLTGNIFSNDPIFICADSSGSPTVTGTVSTADSSAFVADPTGLSGRDPCTNTVLGNPTTYTNQPVEPIPTDDVILGAQAAQNGCLYEGPTELQLAKYTGALSQYIGTYGMDVTSPGTPTGGTSSTANDALAGKSNASICMPSSSGGWVPYPKNGIDFVENCTSSDSSLCNTTTFNPMGQGGNDLYAPDDSQSGWSGPSATSSSTATNGDVLVEGIEQGPLTIAAQDNVVVTGNLCYASWMVGSTCDTTPPTLNATATDVLGLIAYNYVVVNHPMTVTVTRSGSTWNNDSTCTSNQATMGSTTSNSGLQCDLDNPVIDAAILTLNNQYFVSNWDQGNQLDNIYVNGSISEDWRGPVGTGGGTGYDKQYTYDQRLEYLSPPGYLNPGTSSWGIGTISAVTGTCPSTVTGCSTKP